MPRARRSAWWRRRSPGWPEAAGQAGATKLSQFRSLNDARLPEAVPVMSRAAELRRHMRATGLNTFMARIDAAEYGLCRRLNRGASLGLPRRIFQIASRLGDGVIWYALILALPGLYGAAGVRPAIVMALTGALGVALYTLLKHLFVRERPFISDVYFPRVNGVSTSIRTFRQALGSHGVDTLLVAPHYDCPPAAPEEQGVLRVPAARVPRDPEDRRMRWRALTRALDALPASEFDLVHIHTPFLAHYAGVRFARRANIACVATYHTFFEEYLHHYVPVLPRRFAKLLARSFTRSQCAAVQALIAPSEPMRAVLRGYGVSTPIHVLPTGLAADRFRAGDGRAFRARAGIDAQRPLVTYIGRVAHEKNIGFLVQVFQRVLASVPEALLVIAGEGPARAALRQQVAHLGLEGRVHFA